MKIKAAWILLPIVCALPMLGQSNVAVSNPEPLASSRISAGRVDESTRKVKKPIAHMAIPRASRSNTARRRLDHTAAKTNGPRQSPSQRLMTGSPRPHTQSGPSAARLLKTGSVRNAPVHNAPSVRPPARFPSASPSLDNVRHRGPNPAVIGGGDLAARSRGALNGSQVPRRP